MYFKGHNGPFRQTMLFSAFRYQATDSGMEKSIILLNYCIDDIEKFTAQVNLHSKEFKNEHYQATNFTSVFQKFKLSFNLLVWSKINVNFCCV